MKINLNGHDVELLRWRGLDNVPLTYAELIRLANKPLGPVYTIAWCLGDRGGTVRPDAGLAVTDGMVISVVSNS